MARPSHHDAGHSPQDERTSQQGKKTSPQGKKTSPQEADNPLQAVKPSERTSNVSFEDLLRENEVLKSQLRNALTVPAMPKHNEILNITERFEEELFDFSNGPARIPTVTDAGAIIWPSAQCVQNFLPYGKAWTSWIHCALHHPTFERECAAFGNGGTGSAPVEDQHPFWLAVFFSYMCVGSIWDRSQFLAS